MKKKNKKQKKPARQNEQSVSASPFGARNINWKLIITLIGNTVIIFGIYRFAINYYYFEYTLWAYLAAVTLLVLAYVIYNRGFSRNGITEDMLPDTMTPEQKHEFVADVKIRRDKSKWLMTLIFPFIFTFAVEMFELYILEYFKNFFS